MARRTGVTSFNDTITAIATPSGAGAIGVVRISGPATASIAETLLGARPAPRHATYADFLDGRGQTLDRGIALYFPAPRSFTGEDSLELHAHGGPVVLDLIIRRVLELGARLAHPGEFSERAFFNSKIDLAQAEAIADLISSGSAQAARAALASLQGEFSRRIQQLASAIDALRAEVEAWLDFPDESAGERESLAYGARAQAIAGLLSATIGAAREGQLLNDGVRVVLVGRPNAGKSSLFNALARRDRAIVSATPGTTRDTLDATISLAGLSVQLTDTAGLRDSADGLEQEGMRRAHAAVAEADHVLLLVPCDEDYNHTDRRFLESLRAGVTTTIVRTKIDLCAQDARQLPEAGGIGIWLSAKIGTGLELLERRLKEASGFQAGEGAFSARRRHLTALLEVQQALLAAQPLLAQSNSLELAAEHLRCARVSLSTITGEYTTEDLLGRIFSTFCIGK